MKTAKKQPRDYNFTSGLKAGRCVISSPHSGKDAGAKPTICLADLQWLVQGSSATAFLPLLHPGPSALKRTLPSESLSSGFGHDFPDLDQPRILFGSESTKNDLLWAFSFCSDHSFPLEISSKGTFFLWLPVCQWKAWRLNWGVEGGKALGFLDTFL